MKKYNVNIDRPKPSSEEILARRDFDGLMKQYKAAPGKVIQKPFYKTGWFLGTMATAAAAAVAVVVYVSKNDITPEQKSVAPIVNHTNTRNPDSTNNATVYTFQGKQKVSPPLKGLDIAFTHYKINTANGGTITHTSGSKLVFPAHAFVDGNGNAVSGNVEIHYREFRDPADIFLAGIPMQYDSAGKTMQFESAGMLEIGAFVNGKVVYLDKNKTVQVQFASNNSGPQFNIYQFDTTGGNWMYIGKDKIQPKAADQPIVQKEFTPQQKVQIAKIEKQRDSAVVAVVNKIPVPEVPKKPKHADISKNRFSVAVNPKEFPELSTYKDVIWEVDESKTKFDKAYYNVSWEDVKLSKDQSGKYSITLRNGLRVVRLDVNPALEGKSYDDAMKVYDEKFLTYQSAINSRKAAEDATRKNYEDMLTAHGLSAAANSVQNAYQQVNGAVSNAVMRVFNLSGFGLINCDTPGTYPQGAEAMVSFKDEAGQPFLDVLYHVDRNLFSLFGYYHPGRNNIQYDPSSSNLIWGVREGQLYYADNDQFTGLNGLGTMTMHPVQKQFNTPEEMKAFFHIGQ